MTDRSKIAVGCSSLFIHRAVALMKDSVAERTVENLIDHLTEVSSGLTKTDNLEGHDAVLAKFLGAAISSAAIACVGMLCNTRTPGEALEIAIKARILDQGPTWDKAPGEEK